MEKIKGLIDAPFTPFHEDGSLNLAPIPEYAALLARNGLKGVFINGSSGEGYMLTEEERMQLAEAWMTAVPRDFKVIVHVGSTSVMSSRRLAEHAQKIGAPELPFYYYHIPAFNGAFLSMYDFLNAVDGRIPNFAGIKYTFESLYEYNRCRRYQNGKFDMLHGQDETILPCLAMGGAQGGIGGTTNYNGRCLTGILEAWEKGDLEKARQLQDFAQDVIDVICNFRGNIVGGKRIMKLIGLDLGPNRVPFMSVTDEEEQELRRQLEAIDFFSHCNK